MTPKERVLSAAQTYWAAREINDLAPSREALHNNLLDALTAAGVPFEDRQHAAQLGREFLEHPAFLTIYTLAQAVDVKVDALRVLDRYTDDDVLSGIAFDAYDGAGWVTCRVVWQTSRPRELTANAMQQLANVLLTYHDAPRKEN